MKTATKALFGFLALVALCLVCFGCYTLLQGLWQEAPALTPANVDTRTIENHGLPTDQSLSELPYQVTDKYALFNDRVVELYKTDDATLEDNIAHEREVFDAIPSNTRKFLMIMPTAAAFESSLTGLTQEEKDVIDFLYASAPPGVTVVDAYSALEVHADEYIFYRTDEGWTFLDAYYASRALLAACGRQGEDISQYHLDTRAFIIGSYEDDTETELPDDMVSVYTKPGMTNKETVFMRSKDDNLYSFDSATVAVSRQGNGVFLGTESSSRGTLSHVIVKDDGPNDDTIMLVGDEEAKLLVPWLIPAYGHIIYVSKDWSALSRDGFLHLFEEYPVVDFVIFQALDELRASDGNSRLTQLVRN